METYSLEWAEMLARKLVERGATPLLHLNTDPPTVGPSTYFELSGAKVAVQIVTPIEVWAKGVGLDVEVAPHFWYLCINGPSTDLHNAVCSALDLATDEALYIIALLRERGQDVRFTVELLEDGSDAPDPEDCLNTVAALIAALAVSPPNLGGYHDDYYWFWGNIAPEKQRALIREWALGWTQARYYEIPNE